jgi:hypothetical protein
MTYQQFDAQLSRVALALDTSVEDLLLHAPATWAARPSEPVAVVLR